MINNYKDKLFMEKFFRSQKAQMDDAFAPEFSEDERKYFAKLFCEGSQSLHDLLLLLWENKINTFACCAGHKNGCNPYFYFDPSNIKKPALKELLSELISNDKVLQFSIDNTHVPEFDKTRLYKQNSRKGLSFHLKCDENFDEILKIFKQIFIEEKINLYNDKTKEIIKQNIPKRALKFNSLQKDSQVYINDLIDLINFNLNEHIAKAKNNSPLKWDAICFAQIAESNSQKTMCIKTVNMFKGAEKNIYSHEVFNKIKAQIITSSLPKTLNSCKPLKITH